MRSELVYRAHDKVPNRFQLCRLASCSARSMVQNSVSMHTTINQAFEAISGQSADQVQAAEQRNGPASVPDPAIERKKTV